MNLLGNKNNYISELKNPFDKDCVKDISFYLFKSRVSGNFNFASNVSFENGGTEGKQKFTANNFAELVKKTEDFINNL